jgi:hypothetical protein
MRNTINNLKISGKEAVFHYYEYSKDDFEDLIATYQGNDFSIYINVRYDEYHQDSYKITISRFGFSYSHQYLHFQDTQKVLDQLMDVFNYAREKFPERFELLHF